MIAIDDEGFLREKWRHQDHVNEKPPKGFAWIYAICDQHFEVVYIGKTEKPTSVRIGEHLDVAKSSGSSRFSQWLRDNAYVSTIHVIALAAINDHDEVVHSERAFISLAKSICMNLQNVGPGGEGKSGWHHTEETKARISLSSSGRKRSTESIQKGIQTKKDRGYTHSEETRQKISRSNSKSDRTAWYITLKTKQVVCSCGAGPYSFRGMGNHHRRCDGDSTSIN